jgi:benzylsuccinate CoA-transferase BbsF subunit
MGKQALTGVKVLGFVTDGVGPIIGRVLAMYGATVVQVESESRPDGTRLRSPYRDNIPGVNRSYRYALTNPGKYSMGLNMKHPDAAKIAQRLVKWADVVIDNFRPGVLERWNLDYSDVHAIKPDIVMVSVTARGQTGPFRTAAAYGGEISGLTGFIALTGWPDRSPVAIGAYTDSLVPHFAVVSILAALDYRNRTGKGQYIDISQSEAAMQFLAPVILDYTCNNRIQTRDGNRCSYAAPHGVYRCQGEDAWCAIAVFTDSEWAELCDVIGQPELEREPKFSSLKERKNNEDELDELIEKWTMKMDAASVMDKMRKTGIKAGVARSLKDILGTDPQLDYRNHWHRIDQPEMGPLIHRGTSYILNKTPYQFQKPAPRLGEHTEYVCRHFLEMSDEEFVSLYSKNVLK